ncbi:MAG: DNA polymerase III subunit delta [Luteitalea sp.]|nr:DNA polymerase III subunit delta [Luteitalea sp.]
MAVVNSAAVRRQIASGDTDPVYLLQGEDEIEKAALAHEFEAIVEEGLRAFNVQRIHAGELTTGDRLAAAVSDLVDAARTLPMMAPRRVVIVLQADGLLVPRRESDAATRALDDLAQLIEQPEAHTTLVLVAATLDRRGRMYKLLARTATVVESDVIETPGDAERWVKNRVAAANARIEPAGARLLAERCGADVKRLRNDVERLLLYALGQEAITVDDVRTIVGPAGLQDDWAMTNAIQAGDGATALRQLALMLDAGTPPEKILGQLGWVVRTKFPQLAPAGVRSSIEAVFRTDVDLKRSAGDPRMLLERLLVELCAGKRGSALRRF